LKICLTGFCSRLKPGVLKLPSILTRTHEKGQFEDRNCPFKEIMVWLVRVLLNASAQIIELACNVISGLRHLVNSVFALGDGRSRSADTIEDFLDFIIQGRNA